MHGGQLLPISIYTNSRSTASAAVNVRMIQRNRHDPSARKQSSGWQGAGWTQKTAEAKADLLRMPPQIAKPELPHSELRVRALQASFSADPAANGGAIEVQPTS